MQFWHFPRRMFFRGVENVKNVVVIVAAKDGPENNTTRQTHVRPTHTHGSELISIDDLPPVATFELLTGRGYPNIRRPSVNNIRKMSAIDFVKNKNEIESEKKGKEVGQTSEWSRWKEVEQQQRVWKRECWLREPSDGFDHHSSASPDSCQGLLPFR